MKNYLRFLSPVMLLLMAVMFGGGKILAQKTVSLTLSNDVKFGTKSGSTLTQNSVTWKVTTNNNGPINGYNTDYNGQQFGTGKNPWKGTFSTSDIVGKITKIDVAANTGGTASLSVKVGNTDFLSSGKATVNVAKELYGINTYTFEGNATGDVVISLNGSSKACYLGGITVTYMEDEGKTQTTLSFPTPSYTYELGQNGGTVTIEDNIAVLKDKDGKEISDATGKITYSVESSVENFAILGDENSSGIIVDTNKEGTATVTATFAGDDTYAASKASYTINVINVIKSIADLKQQIENTEKTFTLKLTDAVVSYVYGERAYLEDASAGILVYLKDAQTLTAGQKFNGLVEVKAKTWYSLPEITSWAPTASMTTETVTELPLQVVTVEELNNNYDKYEGRRVKVLGATVSKAFSNKNGEITQNGPSITLRAGDTNIKATRNDIVNVIGFPSVYETEETRTIQLAIWEQSAIDVIKTETLTTSAGGYATYSADYAVNYSELGLTAYTLTVDETNKTVTAKTFTGVVPAGGAVLVKGDASKAYTLTPATTEGDATFATDLKTGATKADGTQYGFTTKFDTPAFAQVQLGQDIPAKKGYIVLNGAPAAKYAINFDGEATGIHTIEAASAANGAMYNLAGQRVDKSYKGIVIVNGKKYLNK